MLNHTISGTGKKKIVFIHGSCQSGNTWDSVVAALILQNNYSLFCIDLPGHGGSFRSTEPEKDYILKGLAIHLANFINKNCPDGFIVVTTSLGSNVIAEALPFLQNCKGIFAIGASFIGGPYSLIDLLVPDSNNMLGFLTHPTNDQLDLYLEELVPPQLKEACKQVFLATDPNFREFLREDLVAEGWGDEIQHLLDAKVTVALVYGENETAVLPQYLKNSPITKWRNEIILVSGAGHCVQIEKPLVIAKLIGEFAIDCFI